MVNRFSRRSGPKGTSDPTWNVETLEEAANLAALGVDFVALSSTIWETEGAAERIGKIETALLAALSMA